MTEPERPRSRWWFDWGYALRIAPIAMMVVLVWNAIEGKVMERLAGNVVGVVLAVGIAGIRRRPA
jgi:hypothetical protein